jgi:hypothetical protein
MLGAEQRDFRLSITVITATNILNFVLSAL